MIGYKIPKGFVEGYRNAIEQYPKDSQYAWGMNAVVEALEVYPLEELDENPWQTGTPTEEGEYLCWVSFPTCCTDSDGSWLCRWKDGKWYDNQYEGKLLMNEDLSVKIIAWVKIEPYKEKEDD